MMRSPDLPKIKEPENSGKQERRRVRMEEAVHRAQQEACECKEMTLTWQKLQLQEVNT